MAKNTNAFLPLLGDYFILYAQLLKNNQQDSDTPTLCLSSNLLRQAIKKSLTSFEQSAQEMNLDLELIHKAKYALVAFIDELIIQKIAIVSHEWITNPLQLEYFGENSAGDRFFTQLAEMRIHSERFIDAIELYYLCLELGFTGKFQRGNPAILQLKNDLRTQIQQTRKSGSLSLYINKSEPLPDSRLLIKQSPFLKVATGGVLLTFMVLAVLIGTINYKAKTYRQVILNYESILSGLTQGRQ